MGNSPDEQWAREEEIAAERDRWYRRWEAAAQDEHKTREKLSRACLALHKLATEDWHTNQARKDYARAILNIITKEIE